MNTLTQGVRAWCPDCERWVTASGGMSFTWAVFNMALLVATCGLWLPVMVIMGLFTRSVCCPICHGTGLTRRGPVPARSRNGRR